MSNFVDQPAKPFNIPDQNGTSHNLDQYKGKWLLLYFYPRDVTSGCTVEAKGFRDLKQEFEAENIVILGVSADDSASHQKFIEKEDLNFDLLADTEKELIGAYGLWVEKSMYGKKYMGIQRDSILIDPEGNVVKHYIKAKPKDHPAEVLKDVRELKG